MSAPYLEVRGLKKTFGLKPILRGIDLVLDRGQRIALLGANGAGKTTLLRVLAGLSGPSAGTVCIDVVIEEVDPLFTFYVRDAAAAPTTRVDRIRSQRYGMPCVAARHDSAGARIKFARNSAWLTVSFEGDHFYSIPLSSPSIRCRAFSILTVSAATLAVSFN